MGDIQKRHWMNFSNDRNYEPGIDSLLRYDVCKRIESGGRSKS
jgi:hypothetical protein